MRSIVGVWWIMAVSVLAASFGGSLIFRFLTENMHSAQGIESLICVVALIVLILLIIGIAASIVVTEVLVYYRFYKNFFTDEGYLTFTLPVSRKTLLLSKTVNALIWTGLHSLLFVLCFLVFGLFNVDLELMNLILDSIRKAWESVGAWFILYAVQGLIILLGGALFTISLIQFCITMGSILVKKAKLLAAIGIYYLVNMVLSFIMQIVLFFGIDAVSNLMNVLKEMGKTPVRMGIAVVLFLVIFMIAAFDLVLYFMTLGKLERKLNLS
jgi:hypothetical protein